MCRDLDYRSTVKIELKETFKSLQRTFESEYPFTNKDDWMMLKEDETTINRILIFFTVIGLLICMPLAILIEYRQSLKLKSQLRDTVSEYKLRYLNGEHYL